MTSIIAETRLFLGDDDTNADDVDDTDVEETQRHDSAPSIRLFPTQVEHANMLVDILTRNPIAMDRSMMGMGKTYTTASIIPKFNCKHVIVIAPSMVGQKWNHDIFAKYSLPDSTIMTYEKLRGYGPDLASMKVNRTYRSEVAHGFLMRHDTKCFKRGSNGNQVPMRKVR